MAHVSAIFAGTSQVLGFAVLTPEYEIVLALVDFPSLTAEELFTRSRLSRAGFFNTLDRLKAWNIVVADTSQDDRRCRFYRLNGELRGIILYRLQKYRADFQEYVNGNIDSRDFVTTELTSKRKKGLDYFTTQFKIVLYLYLIRDLPSSVLRSYIDVSETKFRSTLRHLLDVEKVTLAPNHGDRRIKRYDISRPVRSAVEELHAELFAWTGDHETDRGLPIAQLDPGCLPAVKQVAGPLGSP